MRFSIFFALTIVSLFAKAEGVSYLQLIKAPKNDVKLEDYLKVTQREPVVDIGSSLASVRVIRAMERLNVENQNTKPNAEKIANFKTRMEFISKTLTEVKLTLAETLIYIVQLEEYYHLSSKIKDDALASWVAKNKSELVANKQKIFDTTLNYDFEVFKSAYKIMTDINKNPAQKIDVPENLSDEEIKQGLQELEVMKTVFNQNIKCLYDRTCHYCGLSVSKNSCKADTKVSANQIMPTRIDEAITNFNRRFERWAKLTSP